MKIAMLFVSASVGIRMQKNKKAARKKRAEKRILGAILGLGLLASFGCDRPNIEEATILGKQYDGSYKIILKDSGAVKYIYSTAFYMNGQSVKVSVKTLDDMEEISIVE